jgi:PadR family transcriptional regulator, regulatory protein PadR
MAGQVRMTLQTLKVLRTLLSDLGGEHYGLEISKESGLPTGSIYPILARLETAGWVTSAWEQIDESAEGRRRRRYYRLTRDGTVNAQAAVEEMQKTLGGAPQPSGPPGRIRPRRV